jgi:hypothetical protein
MAILIHIAAIGLPFDRDECIARALNNERADRTIANKRPLINDMSFPPSITR